MKANLSPDEALVAEAPEPEAKKTQAPPPPPTPITLLPHQVEHFERMFAMYEAPHKLRVIVDTSETGSGKTYTAGKLAQVLALPSIVVICPTSAVETVWRPFLQKHLNSSSTTTRVLSYAELRNGKNSLVMRTQRINQHGEEGTRFIYTATPEYQAMARAGVFVIVDESHNAKNQSHQAKAVLALLEPVHHGGAASRSRALLCSATPFDKQDHLLTIIRLLGLTRHERLYHVSPFDGRIVLDGMLDVIWLARKMAPEAAEQVEQFYPMYGLFRDNMRKALARFYFECINQNVTSAMAKPAPTHRIVIENGFYKVSDTDLTAIREALQNLRTVAQSREDGLGTGSQYLAMHSHALKVLEYGKREVFLRLIEEVLTRDPRAKVIVFLSYLDTLKWLQAALQKYAPLVLCGKVPKHKREIVVAKLQAPTLKHRLLLGITQVSGESISLHDIHGDSSRYLFLSPTFNLSNLYQGIGRVNRVGVQSDTFIRIVYAQVPVPVLPTANPPPAANNGPPPLHDELRLRMALESKSVLLRRSLNSRVSKQAVLPDQFSKYMEP